eukprot:GHVN01058530.1.p1 GENE.GHVN01058530.1~~GHVN01058530.1.p1  ORF type:complete len:556 (+),score=48.49 GHVN01058530.1:52-1668(+)
MRTSLVLLFAMYHLTSGVVRNNAPWGLATIPKWSDESTRVPLTILNRLRRIGTSLNSEPDDGSEDAHAAKGASSRNFSKPRGLGWFWSCLGKPKTPKTQNGEQPTLECDTLGARRQLSEMARTEQQRYLQPHHLDYFDLWFLPILINLYRGFIVGQADYAPNFKNMKRTILRYESQLKGVVKDLLMQLLKYVRQALGLYAVGLSLLLPYYVKEIEAFNRVELNDSFLLSYYDLPDTASPAMFGLDYTDIEVPSTDDPSITLSGWLIKSSNPHSKKTLLCVHGWFANRQACLPFVRVAQKVGLLSDHNICMIDLRNSGASSPSRTDVGMKGAQDLLDTLTYLKDNHGMTHTSLYCQSIGCMSAMTLQDLYQGRLESEGIKLDRIVMDSPVANAKDVVRWRAPSSLRLSGIVSTFYDSLMWLMNQRWGRQLSRMKASTLLREFDRNKVLILQSEEDSFARWSVLRSELSAMRPSQRPKKVFLFREGQHANIYRDNQEDYEAIVHDFFRPWDIGRILFGRRLPNAGAVNWTPENTATSVVA